MRKTKLTVPRRVCLVLGLAGFVLRPAVPVLGRVPDIAVVVNPDVPVNNLTRAGLRNFVLGDYQFWPGGVRVTLVIQEPPAPERDAAVKDLCAMTEKQWYVHWKSRANRAETDKLRLLFPTEDALYQVSRTPGAIAFVKAPVTNKGVKVLKIDGKAPGEAGYSVR